MYDLIFILVWGSSCTFQYNFGKKL